MRDNMEQVRVLVDLSSDGEYQKLAGRLRELGEEFELPLQVLKLTDEGNLDQLGVLTERIWEDVPVILPLVVSPNHSITYNCLTKIMDSGVSAGRVNLIDFDKDYAFITEVKPGSHRTRQMLVRGVSEHRKLDRGAGGKREKPLRTRGD